MHRLKALPVKLLQIEGGVVIKRGCTEVKIVGDDASEVVQTVLAAAKIKGGVTQEKICDLFTASSRPAIEELLQQLKERRLLIEVAPERENTHRETPLDIFYWQFGQNTQTVQRHLNSHHFLVCGVNPISSRIVTGLSSSGARNVAVIDHPQLRSKGLFDQAGRLLTECWPMSIAPPHAFPIDVFKMSFDCLVVATEFGMMRLLRDLNEKCIKEKRHFYPVVLQNMIGYAGPLVMPRETACLECLCSRQDSHMEDPVLQRIFEEFSFESRDVMGYHPSMANVLGDISALELVKFYGRVCRDNAGKMIELNLRNTSLVTRRVLKVPRCRICSALQNRPTVSMNKNGFVSLNTLNK